MSAKPKHTLVLKPELRRELRNPLGKLLQGTPQETMKQLGELIIRERPGHVISVGDVVSQNMLKQGIHSDIIIVDGKIMREEAQPIDAKTHRRIVVENPAGTITPQAWLAIDRALKQKKPTLIAVEGEEDLFTLVAVLRAPKNSLVVYGQPNEGVVAVKVDETAKHKVDLIIQAMEPAKKLK